MWSHTVQRKSTTIHRLCYQALVSQRQSWKTCQTCRWESKEPARDQQQLGETAQRELQSLSWLARCFRRPGCPSFEWSLLRISIEHRLWLWPQAEEQIVPWACRTRTDHLIACAKYNQSESKNHYEKKQQVMQPERVTSFSHSPARASLWTALLRETVCKILPMICHTVTDVEWYSKLCYVSYINTIWSTLFRANWLNTS